ncbi:MAG: hypothetical protein HY332_13010 [Chloroflexi bacterium]|nr:hypothetical protein [Chloroflexota bacterium]
MLSRRIFIQDGFKVVSLGLAMPHIFTRAVEAAGVDAGREPACHRARRRLPQSQLLAL